MSHFATVTRRDSRGTLHRIVCDKDSEAFVRKHMGRDSVQRSADGRFKIGDRVRPTRRYVEECCQGQVPYEAVADWAKGFVLTEIGPEGAPFPGHHHIECDGLDMLFLDTTSIEKV